MLFIKTETGQAAFKERSQRFSSRQRAAFILVDGKRAATQILVATEGLGVTQADLDYMVEQGFLSPVLTEVPVLPVSSTLAPLVSEGLSMLWTDQERYQLAKPLATQLTATLGLRGFMLNLSVESAAGYQALLELFPQIQKAVGAKAARDLERVLVE